VGGQSRHVLVLLVFDGVGVKGPDGFCVAGLLVLSRPFGCCSSLQSSIAGLFLFGKVSENFVVLSSFGVVFSGGDGS